jgi:hypothetical protein
MPRLRASAARARTEPSASWKLWLLEAASQLTVAGYSALPSSVACSEVSRMVSRWAREMVPATTLEAVPAAPGDSMEGRVGGRGGPMGSWAGVLLLPPAGRQRVLAGAPGGQAASRMAPSARGAGRPATRVTSRPSRGKTARAASSVTPILRGLSTSRSCCSGVAMVAQKSAMPRLKVASTCGQEARQRVSSTACAVGALPRGTGTHRVPGEGLWAQQRRGDARGQNYREGRDAPGQLRAAPIARRCGRPRGRVKREGEGGRRGRAAVFRGRPMAEWFCRRAGEPGASELAPSGSSPAARETTMRPIRL